MNVNLLLENSKRTCSIGENIFTKDRYEGRDKWGEPAFGLCGKFAIGHQLGPVDGNTGELIDGDHRPGFGCGRFRGQQDVRCADGRIFHGVPRLLVRRSAVQDDVVIAAFHDGDG